MSKTCTACCRTGSVSLPNGRRRRVRISWGLSQFRYVRIRLCGVCEARLHDVITQSMQHLRDSKYVSSTPKLTVTASEE